VSVRPLSEALFVAHVSLYRTYRPQRFEDVVGQSHVTRTLRNALTEGTVAHAYLFSGPRGTGKTTTARILAKALNCEIGPTPDFDDTCQNCRDIADGRHPDVYELDAASRTGVDAIRDEIITKVSYAATRGGWKVYIIDEVHMLSTSAFNALLKTLEEPPPHTVFVLCTTHPHKVPETIHSRCQRFDFRRISAEDIVERLKLIAEREGIEVAPGALTLIAKHASGGMRDAISTLDQLAAFTGKSISMDDVEGLLGEVDSALLFGVADAVARRDVAACFRQVAILSEAGVDITEFVKGLTGHFRDLFVVAAVGDAEGIVDTTDEDLAKLAVQAGVFGRERLARMLDVLAGLSGEIRWAGDARLALEVSLVRMARPEGELTLEALSERIAALEAGTPAESLSVETYAVAPSPPAAPEPERAAPAPSRDVADTKPAAAAAVAPAPHADGTQAYTPPASGSMDRAKLKRAWPAVVAEIKKKRHATSVLFSGAAVDADGDTLVVEFPADQKVTMQLADTPEAKQLLRQAAHTVLGVKPPVRYQLGRGAVRHEEAAGSDPAPAPAHRPSDAADTHTDPAGDPDALDMLKNAFGDIIVEHHEETE
jgi:DNA polymerase III subunit gamma/tau